LDFEPLEALAKHSSRYCLARAREDGGHFFPGQALVEPKHQDVLLLGRELLPQLSQPVGMLFSSRGDEVRISSASLKASAVFSRSLKVRRDESPRKRPMADQLHSAKSEKASPARSSSRSSARR